MRNLPEFIVFWTFFTDLEEESYKIIGMRGFFSKFIQNIQRQLSLLNL